MAELKKKPLKKFRAGQITATIWENEREINEVMTTVHSITIEKNYTVGKDEWKTTNSYNVLELHKVILVAQAALEELQLKGE